VTEQEELKRWHQSWKLITTSTRPQIEIWLKAQDSEMETDMRRRLNVTAKNRNKARK